ncbi:very short patch repair endonuclease [Azoarcus taiwanensis]|uniref:DNA mismatch endonuclease Vsr n=1 Tax=Azoarcus taiwanensis TaxID=666964 RepID=A0A972JAZ6_9RHOO|nr:very short patch repair endonuclease [Azoarcus taiwanensis]NMG03593.1 DNA mismatch endonuclease Vsr [Azoarcus taiwanensis]
MQHKKKRRLDPLTKSEQMARVRGADTGPEMVLRRALWRAGLRYKVRPSVPGRPDLAFVGCKIAVFVDGCFWHGCQDHYKPPATNASFWSEKIARNQQRDREVENALGALGWTVLRYWEHEVEGDLASVVDRIRTEVARSRADGASKSRQAGRKVRSS